MSWSSIWNSLYHWSTRGAPVTWLKYKALNGLWNQYSNDQVDNEKYLYDNESESSKKGENGAWNDFTMRLKYPHFYNPDAASRRPTFIKRAGYMFNTPSFKSRMYGVRYGRYGGWTARQRMGYRRRYGRKRFSRFSRFRRGKPSYFRYNRRKFWAGRRRAMNLRRPLLMIAPPRPTMTIAPPKPPYSSQYRPLLNLISPFKYDLRK